MSVGIIPARVEIDPPGLPKCYQPALRLTLHAYPSVIPGLGPGTHDLQSGTAGFVDPRPPPGKTRKDYGVSISKPLGIRLHSRTARTSYHPPLVPSDRMSARCVASPATS